MISKIHANRKLKDFLDKTCCENGICVEFDEGLSADDYIVIKVDSYYNSLNLSKTPASIDCLIFRRCNNGGFGLTLIELKAISSSKRFDLKNVIEKFETTLFSFMKKDFKEIFDINYKEIKLLFVTNKQINKRDLGLKYESLINKRFKFNDKTVMITPKMPSPAIKKCYS